jgi:hypothetical protein
VLEGVLVNEAIEVQFECTGHLRRSPGAGTIEQTLGAVVGKAIDPLAERGIGKVQRVRDGLPALACDDLAYRLGTAEDASLLGLFHDGV